MSISPLSEQQLKALHDLIDSLSDSSKAWLAGYLWGISHSGRAQTPDAPRTLSPSTTQDLATKGLATAPITLLSASHTGNARKVAHRLHDELSAAGLNVTHSAIDAYSVKALASERYLIIVTSTQGDGEPPEEAYAFVKFLHSRHAPALHQTHFAVFGLGDSTYAQFCQAGKDIDQRLDALGAARLLDRVDADVDYETVAQDWRGRVLDSLRALTQATSGHAASTNTAQAAVSQAPRIAAAWHRAAPFTAPVLAHQKITGRYSDRDVRHIELDLSGSGLTYTPGDALGVWYVNDAALVDEYLKTLSLPGDAPVTVQDTILPLHDALMHRLELTVNSARLIEHYALATNSGTLAALVREGRPALHAYANSTPPIDMLRQHPPAEPLSATQLVSCLRPLTPRLYSIASSQAEVNDEVHLTVGVIRHSVNGHERTGGASGYLSRLGDNDHVRVFIERNEQFRLPSDPATPIIMVGPGTGIAPFRAFMQQRAWERACGKGRGRNWLFFGNPHFTEDFLYQVEWQHYVKEGVLDRIDLAWSRDHAAKLYVQNRLLAQGAGIWQWLNEGAHLYVCGSASPMAHDVDTALVNVIQTHGGRSHEAAVDYLSALRSAHRYQRDIY